MPTTPITFEKFGGLNLSDSPEEVGPLQAVDCSNVDVDQLGRVRTRAGISSSIVSVSATSVDGLAAFETTSGTRQFVLAYTNGATLKYAAYASTGGAAVATATPTATPISAARIATGSNEYLYIANGTDTVWRWTGAAFSQPAGMPAVRYLAVTPTSNRLAGARTSSLPSRVYFSSATNPESWNTADPGGDWVDLTPGDGSPITGLVSWQRYVFAFKRDRFFVFTGESVDSDGGAVFNYDTIDTYGSIVPPVTGDEGVYFFDGRSVWVTSRGVPRNVSRPVEPFLRALATLGVSTGYTVDQTALTSTRLFYSLGKLYVRLKTTGSGSGLVALVFDPKVNAWTVYAPVLDWMTTLRTSGTEQPFTHFAYGGGAFGDVYKFDSSLTTDDSSAISWSWTSGATDLGYPGRTKITLESRVWGTGSVKLQVANDYGSFDTGSTLTLGTSPAIDDAWQQIDREGGLWQHKLSGTSAGSVRRLAHYLSFVKPPGTE